MRSQVVKNNKVRAQQYGLTEHFTWKEWAALCAQFNYRCVGCGRNTALSADHVVPLSRGGTNTIDNIQPLCLSCNSTKHDRVIDCRNNPHPDTALPGENTLDEDFHQLVVQIPNEVFEGLRREAFISRRSMTEIITEMLTQRYSITDDASGIDSNVPSRLDAADES